MCVCVCAGEGGEWKVRKITSRDQTAQGAVGHCKDFDFDPG